MAQTRTIKGKKYNYLVSVASKSEATKAAARLKARFKKDAQIIKRGTGEYAIYSAVRK